MRALVTGATGFVGSHLAETLRRQGVGVTALVRSPAKAAALLAQGVRTVAGDLHHLPALREATSDADIIFHVAGLVAARNEAEFLAGIPGTVGGALAMNAGCHGGETWRYVDRVLMLTRGGELIERAAGDFSVGYRHVGLKAASDEIFAAAWFRFPPGDAQAAAARTRELLQRRVATQPLALPNAGSVFRNPPGDHAARLIEAAGLKGARIGAAEVSEKHSNFIVNPGGAASAGAIEMLIGRIQADVAEKFGVHLVREVRIVGDADVRMGPGGEGA